MRASTLPLFYYIIVPAFADSNSDGLGDINGIIKRLPEIAKLQVTHIVLSPIFLAEREGWHRHLLGFQVIDHMSIDPMLGDLEDLKKLIQAAKRLKIGIILDFPCSLFSDKSNVFLDSLEPNSKFKKSFYGFEQPLKQKMMNFSFSQYIWLKAKNNKYYYCLFGNCPYPNFHDQQIKNYITDVLLHWVKLGIEGFRIDNAHLMCTDINDPGYGYAKNPDLLEHFAKQVRQHNENTIFIYENFGVPEDVQLKAHAHNYQWQSPIRTNQNTNSDKPNASTDLYDDSAVRADFIYGTRHYLAMLSNHDISRIATRCPKASKDEFVFMLIQLYLTGQPAFLLAGDEIRLGLKASKHNSNDMCSNLTPPWFSAHSLRSDHYKTLYPYKKYAESDESLAALCQALGKMYHQMHQEKWHKKLLLHSLNKGLMAYVFEYKDYTILVAFNSAKTDRIYEERFEELSSTTKGEVLYKSSNKNKIGFHAGTMILTMAKKSAIVCKLPSLKRLKVSYVLDKERSEITHQTFCHELNFKLKEKIPYLVSFSITEYGSYCADDFCETYYQQDNNLEKETNLTILLHKNTKSFTIRNLRSAHIKALSRLYLSHRYEVKEPTNISLKGLSYAYCLENHVLSIEFSSNIIPDRQAGYPLVIAIHNKASKKGLEDISLNCMPRIYFSKPIHYIIMYYPQYKRWTLYLINQTTMPGALLYSGSVDDEQVESLDFIIPKAVFPLTEFELCIFNWHSEGHWGIPVPENAFYPILEAIPSKVVNPKKNRNDYVDCWLNINA